MTSPASAAERQRRYRERRRRGAMVVPVELNEADLDALAASGLLNGQRPFDANDCADALRGVLDQLQEKPLCVTRAASKHR